MPESTGRGALTEAVYYILLSLYNQPMHGYGVMQQVQQMSDGRVVLGAGTLYGALNTLLEKGWIAAAGTERAARKKEYVITAAGRGALAAELVRLGQLVEHGCAVMGGTKDAGSGAQALLEL